MRAPPAPCVDTILQRPFCGSRFGNIRRENDSRCRAEPISKRKTAAEIRECLRAAPVGPRISLDPPYDRAQQKRRRPCHWHDKPASLFRASEYAGQRSEGSKARKPISSFRRSRRHWPCVGDFFAPAEAGGGGGEEPSRKVQAARRFRARTFTRCRRHRSVLMKLDKPALADGGIVH